MPQSGTLAALALLLAALVLGLPSATHASRITFGPSTSGTYTLTGTGAGSIIVRTAGLSGSAFFDANSLLGTFTLGSAGFLTGPQSGNLFPAFGNETFRFVGVDGDTLNGSIIWKTFTDSSSFSELIGVMTINSISGDNAFLTTFSSPFANIDLTINSESALISSGEVFTTATPEPGSLALFGLGLLVIGICLHRNPKFKAILTTTV